MKFLIPLFAVMMAAASQAPAQSDFSSLEEQMSGSEFRGSGLDKLSDEELARLNDWIRNNLNVEAATDVKTRQEIRREVEEQVRAEQEEGEIVTTIPGKFEGWRGNTVFELANGQVWRQKSGGSYRVNMQDPTVIIYPAAFGAWRLRLEDTGPSIGVERVK